MENGGGGEHRPWEFDQQTVDIYRTFVKLHYALVPYLMQTASDSYQANKSMVSFFNKFDYQYLLGNDLFVAPFLDTGINIDITFPPGDNWVYLFDSTMVYSGGTTQTLIVSLDEFPVFVKEGKDIFTGIGNIMANSNINIYPNPVSSISIISYPNSNSTLHKIQLFNIAGKLVWETSNSTGIQLLNRGDLVEGIYFLIISNEKHKLTKKVLFQ